MKKLEAVVMVGADRMKMPMAMPDGAGPFATVLLAHHREGLDEFTHATIARLAENGFAAAAPDLYHRRPAGEDTQASRYALNDIELTADIAAAVAHLQTLPAVRGDAIAIAGHCVGGRIAFLGAATCPSLKAAAMFYGGNIFREEGSVAPFALAKNIHGPVLGSFGEDDKNPSPADVAKISAEFTRFGIRHDFHSYAGAGHAFQDFSSPGSYREGPSEAAWVRFLAFLRAEL